MHAACLRLGDLSQVIWGHLNNGSLILYNGYRKRYLLFDGRVNDCYLGVETKAGVPVNS